MSITDYVIDILLILLIFRQVRPHELTPRAALLPLALRGRGRDRLPAPVRPARQ